MYVQFENFADARRAVAVFLADRVGGEVSAQELDHVELSADTQLVRPAQASDPAASVASPPLVPLLSALLATVHAKEQEAAHQLRRAAAVFVHAQRDGLTGLDGRGAWERALAREEQRCQRYGQPAAVLMVDLDDLKATNDSLGHAAGDALLQRAAQALLTATRRPDGVARLGGDEFGVLALNCNAAALAVLDGRIRAALTAADVRASVGGAVRTAARGLSGAWVDADAAMYADKRRSKRAS